MNATQLRRFILDFAVRGKLVAQDANDEPAIELLKRIQAAKARSVKGAQLKRSAETSDDELEAPFALPKLWVRVGPKEDSLAPYQIQVSVRGVVRMHLTQANGQTEERRVRALVNGVSLLYGVVREMVSNITSRSAHGQLLLPSLSFADLASHKAGESAVASNPVLDAPKAKVRKVAVSKARAKA